MTTYTKSEWEEKGKKLFGEDKMKWEFKCPVCKKSQSVESFREFKDSGAKPDDAYQQCRGRFTGGKKGPDKCDWAAFGLFRGPDSVTHEGKEIFVFPFTETTNQRSVEG